MKKTASLLVLIIAGLLNVFAENLPKKATENPLDLAAYLTFKENDKRRTQAVAEAFFDAGRFDDAMRAIELVDYARINWLIYRAQILDERRNSPKAAEYAAKALALLENEDASADSYALVVLAGLLIKFNRNEDAARIVDKTSQRYYVLFGIAREFIKAGKTAEASKLLPPFSEIEDDDDKAITIELHARLRQTEKAEKLLAEFEPTAFINTTVYNQKSILFPLVRANLALGKTDHAAALWERYGDNRSGYSWIDFIEALIEFGQHEKANLYLASISGDREISERHGGDLVALYLKLGNLEKSQSLARAMSEEFDSYAQQQALIKLADHLIANSKSGAAEEILDFAFRRASRIEFAHEDMQSKGASSGTRKIIYLRNIYLCYMKIGQFPKALAAINAIGSEHWIAKEFVRQTLFDFLKQRAKNQPRSLTENLLKQMQNSLSERFADEDLSQSKLFTAEIYALLGEKARATEMLGKLISEEPEGFGFLLSAGIIFERYKLKPDANFKKLLREFVDS